MPGRIRQFLRKLFPSAIRHGRVIPEDARVDPGQFPPDEFPLRCPDCDYLLRGLEVNRCPECGRPFDPGRLLVEQYVLNTTSGVSRRTRRWGIWLMVLGYICANGPFLLIYLLALLSDKGISPFKPWDLLDLFIQSRNYIMVTAVLGVLAMMTGGFITLPAYLRNRAKSKRVFDAIDRESAAFRMAQRIQWRMVPLFVVVVLAIVASDVLRGGRGLDYYGRNPWRVLIPIGLAAGVGVFIYLVLRIVRKIQKP